MGGGRAQGAGAEGAVADCEFVIFQAPEGCLQYFFGSTTGTIRSFNKANNAHLADQNQAICIRRESNTCQVCYTQSSDDDFKLSGSYANSAWIQCGYHGTSGMATDYDQLIIPGGTDFSKKSKTGL